MSQYSVALRRGKTVLWRMTWLGPDEVRFEHFDEDTTEVIPRLAAGKILKEAYRLDDPELNFFEAMVDG